jgi:hypothetical protein
VCLCRLRCARLRGGILLLLRLWEFVRVCCLREGVVCLVMGRGMEVEGMGVGRKEG